MIAEKSLLAGIIFCAAAVILGAFGAHLLKELLDEQALISYETGVRYQFFHGLALILLGLYAKFFKLRPLWTYRLFLIGIFFFSFSIYGLVLGKTLGFSTAFLGPITPLGGLLLIAAWVIWSVNVYRNIYLSTKKVDKRV